MLASKYFQKLEQNRQFSSICPARGHCFTLARGHEQNQEENEAKGFTKKKKAKRRRFAFSAKQGLDYNVDFSTIK